MSTGLHLESTKKPPGTPVKNVLDQAIEVRKLALGVSSADERRFEGKSFTFCPLAFTLCWRIHLFRLCLVVKPIYSAVAVATLGYQNSFFDLLDHLL